MEVTQKKKEANAINAQKGGVKTPEGKAISSQNSFKHGLFSKFCTEYDEISFDEVYQDFELQFKIVRPIDHILIKQLAVTYIRILRCIRYETELLRSTLNPRLVERVCVRKPSFPLFELDEGEYEEKVISEGEKPTLSETFYPALECVVLKYEPALWARFVKIIEMLSR